MIEETAAILARFDAKIAVCLRGTGSGNRHEAAVADAVDDRCDDSGRLVGDASVALPDPPGQPLRQFFDLLVERPDRVFDLDVKDLRFEVRRPVRELPALHSQVLDLEEQFELLVH